MHACQWLPAVLFAVAEVCIACLPPYMGMPAGALAALLLPFHQTLLLMPVCVGCCRYDGTVRNSAGDVVQFLYGEDGMDAVRIEGQVRMRQGWVGWLWQAPVHHLPCQQLRQTLLPIGVRQGSCCIHSWAVNHPHFLTRARLAAG